MKLAIADPPYLGRGERWYGDGRGHFDKKRNSDHHPEASEWDSPLAHIKLVERLMRDFDGWVIAGAPDSLSTYLTACPPDVRVMVWHRANAIPSGSRIAGTWEFVIAYIPKERRGRGIGLATSDVLISGVDSSSGFVGSKPSKWTRWVLDALGYQPGNDELIDLFPGSGAVAAAADGMLNLAELSATSELSVIAPTPISPDCRDCKCLACTGSAWDFTADTETVCLCSCHQIGEAA